MSYRSTDTGARPGWGVAAWRRGGVGGGRRERAGG